MSGTGAPAELFVGRERELTELRGWLTDAQAGRGRLALLRGESGVGKTRLAQELSTVATSAALPVVWSRCPADAGAPPLWPLRRIVSQLPGSHSGLPSARDDSFGSSAEDSAAARFAQFEWLADAVVRAAETDALLVIVEDLHWADSATAAALGYLAAELPRSRALVLVTARLLVESAPVGEVLDRPGVLQRQLAGLDRAAIVAYLDSVSGGGLDERYADLVLRQTAGNSLFVAAVVRLLAAGVSLRSYDENAARAALAGRRELIDLVREPMGRVSADCRRLVQTASVAGEDCSVAELVAAMTLPAEAVLALLAEAVRADLLTLPADAPGIARFVHALVRDGVYDNVERTTRCRMHRALAEIVASSDTGSERIATVASHLARGATTPAEHISAATAARAAGRAALADLAYAEAAGRFRAALHSLAMAGGTTSTERSETLLELALAEYRSGAFGDSLEHCVLAADLAESEGRWDLLARAALLVDGVALLGADSLLALCRRAADLVPDDQLSLRSQLQARLAYAAADDGDLTSAQRMSAESLALAEGTDDPAALLAALRARHQAMAGPEYGDERRQLGTRAVELAQRGEPMAALWGRLWRIDTSFERGDLVAIDRGLAELERLTGQLRFPLARWHLARLRAARESMVGRFDIAQAHNRVARELAGELDDQSLITLYYAFQFFDGYVRGTMTAGDRRAEFAGFVAMVTEVKIPIAVASAALALVHMGDVDEAGRLVRQLCADAPGWPRDGAWLATVAILANAVTDIADATCADIVYPLLEPFPALAVAGGSGSVACDGSVSRHLGRLAATCDRLELAERHLRDAIAHEERMGARPFAALSRMCLAAVLQAQGGAGNLATAAQTARTALAAFRRMDMPGRAEQCAQLVASIDTDASRRTGLTARENEIVVLVAEGLSNRQIAGQLYVSERTVETHVSHVLAKVGGSSRTDIVAWAYSTGVAAARQ
ncbi:MAG: AAA family ATPase [Geodermatophilaceae bacterium]|nr:AAA family ATPase [Geodermatophilaceae bacterium]